jgi:hypothetical protein
MFLKSQDIAPCQPVRCFVKVGLALAMQPRRKQLLLKMTSLRSAEDSERSRIKCQARFVLDLSTAALAPTLKDISSS